MENTKQKNNQEESVEEAEIIEIQDSMEGSNSKVDDIIRLEGIIKRYLVNISSLDKELKEKRSMFEDIFANDAIFKQHDDKVKEMSKIKNNTKAQIMKQSDAAELMLKVRDLREKIKEIKLDLSDYAQQYYEASGSKQIMTDDGEEMEIVLSTKLIKKNTKFNP